jgi:antitoxin component YwqK of YwqJK toxin-antitoxin module
MKDFYVYGLIDPRTNSIFYIGKGKGKRVFQHFNEEEDYHSNTEKLKIIKEIQKEGLDVNHFFIVENLNEDAALLLERLLIYRIGRNIFDEGCLTNIVPGGKWHTEASLFLKEDDLPTIDTINMQFPELIPILEKYPKVSKAFTGLSCQNNPEDKMLFVYNHKGEKNYDWDLDYFIKLMGLGTALDFINIIKETSMPIYFRDRVWCKINYEKLDDSSKIPFQDLDIIDFDFVKQINIALEKNEDTTIKSFFKDDMLLAEFKISPNTKETVLTYYYPNGNKKYVNNYIEGQLNGKCLSWHPNGQLKEEVEYIRNYHQNRKRYFSSGNIEMIENLNTNGIGYSAKLWYDNGQLNFEGNEDGTSFTYSETGSILSKSIRTGDLDNGGILTTWDYADEEKVKKETKMYRINGLLHGYEKSYYDTGELKKEVDYTNGYNNKIVRSYKKNGEVTIK